MSPRFPSPVIDQMLTRGQITRVAPNRTQANQLLTQSEAHLRTRNATEYGSDRHPSATAVDVDEAVEMATTIHQGADRVLDHMFPY